MNELSLEDVLALLKAVQENQISELKIKQDDFSIKIKGNSSTPTVVVSEPIPTESTTLPPLPSQPVPALEPKGTIVTSPIVGTFYSSPSPEKPDYVAVGSTVEQGDILFIIESMKLMNEVVSDYTGTVTAIHVADGEPVEYGQPILTIE